MMLETIREYALVRLVESEEAEALRRQHTSFFLALTEAAEPELRGPKQIQWLERLEAELDNLRAALAWSAANAPEVQLRLASALGPFWLDRGYLSEGRWWLERVLRVAGQAKHASGTASGTAEASPAFRAKALIYMAELVWAQSDYGTAAALLEESLALFRELGDQRGIAHALSTLGGLACDQGDYARAAALSAESLALCRKLGDRVGMAHAVHRLGDLARDQGDYGRAAALLEEALALYRAGEDTGGIAWALNGLGDLALAQGDASRALALYHESETRLAELGETQGLALVRYNLGRAALQAGDPGRAATWFAESLALAREVGDTGGIARAYTGLGAVARAEGDAARATALYRESLGLYDKLGARPGIAGCLEGLAATAMIPQVRFGEVPMVGQHGQRSPSTERARQAARLFGAAQALRAAIPLPITPVERPGYDRTIATVRASLDAQAFAAAWVEGASMPLEQAIAYALGEAT